MVDVQHRAVRALEEDAPAALDLVDEVERRIADVRGKPLPEGEVLAADRIRVGDGAAHAFEGGIANGEQRLEPGAEVLRVEQVDDAQSAARHLVLVAGADSPARGADLARAGLLLGGHVDRAVYREDEVGALVDLQLLEVREVAAPAQFVDLPAKHGGIDDDAVADHAGRLRVQHPRRHQVHDRALVADHQGVPGVVAALEAHDDVGMGGEEVDDLPLALVAPLGADDHQRRHAIALRA